MIVDCNLISYYTEDEIFPYPRYESGSLEDQKSIYKYSEPEDTNPLLALSDDIIFASGLGLKKGFYRVKLSEDFNFLLLYTNGRISAKVPIIKLEVINTKPRKLLKKQKKWQFWHKKDHLGESSEDFIHQKAEVKFDPKINAYLLFWERGNTKAVGVIKLED